jgi:hypothetical protein
MNWRQRQFASASLLQAFYTVYRCFIFRLLYKIPSFRVLRRQ